MALRSSRARGVWRTLIGHDASRELRFPGPKQIPRDAPAPGLLGPRRGFSRPTRPSDARRPPSTGVRSQTHPDLRREAGVPLRLLDQAIWSYGNSDILAPPFRSL